MKIKNLDCITHMQWSCKTWRRNRFKVIHGRPNQFKRRKEISQHSWSFALLSQWTLAGKVCRCGSSCVLSKLQFAWVCAAWLECPYYYEQRGVTASTWGLLYEHAFCIIFKVNFADMALASDLGDVEPCRIEVLQRIQYVGGTRLDGLQARKQWELVKICCFCFRGWAMHSTRSMGSRLTALMTVRPCTLAPHPSDLRHVSDEVLEDAIAIIHAARVALSDGQEERTSDFRTRVLGGHGTLAATGSACDVIQGHANTMEARDFCKQHSLQVSLRFNLRDLGDRAAGILARAWSAQHPNFMNAGRAGTPCSAGCPCTLKATYTEPPETTELASTLGERLAWEVETVRRLFRDWCQDISGETSSWNDTRFTVRSLHFPRFGLTTRHTF